MFANQVTTQEAESLAGRNDRRSRANRIFWNSVLHDASECALELANSGADPERDRLARERLGLVRDAIAGLPESLRVAVLLRDYAGLEHREAARLSGLSPVAARKRYSRALATLSRRLAPVLDVR